VVVPLPTPTPTPSPTPSPTPTPTPTVTPSPEPPGSTDFVWVDDGVPAGATLSSDNDSWNWLGENPGPFTGYVAHHSNIYRSYHQHSFYAPNTPMLVREDEVLFVYIYLDPANLPRQVMLQWRGVSRGWEHRAYWGANLINAGNNGSSSRRYMGPLPRAGQWVRLEVPADRVGLEGKRVNGMSFALYGGKATWDRAGKGKRPRRSRN
jgi:hypothetical protein